MYLSVFFFRALSLQRGAQTELANSPPVFRASTHLVLLDVVVTDKDGKPVPGLGVEDFSVKEAGKV